MVGRHDRDIPRQPFSDYLDTQRTAPNAPKLAKLLRALRHDDQADRSDLVREPMTSTVDQAMDRSIRRHHGTARERVESGP